MIRVGIPRALLYYQYYPAWKAFFEKLGASVVVSPPTTPAMLVAGSARVVADTCLPVKVFLGHVLALVDQCDCLFIPVIRSVKGKTYNCSKFLGLPDMTRAVVPESPPVLDIEIDVNRGKWALNRAIYRLGRHFAWNPLAVREAGLAAWETYGSYRGLMSAKRLTPPRAINEISGTEPGIPSRQKEAGETAIALVGHPYLLYDEYINHRIIHRLEAAGSRIVTPEMLAARELEAGITQVVGQAYWTYEAEVVGAGGHYLRNGVDGIIGIMAFGCGPDSLMMDMVRREATRLKATPFMNLTLEEHTAEAGVITRLEAFLDMVERKKRKQQ
ncbi:MAG: acyl-CoA dehydratase activase-related protein [Chloroflexota bacterium]